jgi:hypothetical protein
VKGKELFKNREYKNIYLMEMGRERKYLRKYRTKFSSCLSLQLINILIAFYLGEL